MDFIPSACRPRTPTGVARRPGRLSPLRGLCLAGATAPTPAHLVVLGRLCIQRWQCKACLGSASPLPPDVTSRQRPQTFRELVTDLYVHCVSLRGLSRLLALLGCGGGGPPPCGGMCRRWPPALTPDPQAKLSPWVEVDETWLSIGGAKRPVAVVLGPEGRTAGSASERSRLRLGRLVHGLGRAQGAGRDDRRRPGLRPGPGSVGPGPATVCRAHAAHRGAAHPGYRRGRPDPLGPGPAAHPATPGPGSDRRRRDPSCWRSGRR